MFSMQDPKERQHLPSFLEFNADIEVLSKTISKGNLNERDVADLTMIIKKIGDVKNKPFFDVQQTEKFLHILQKLEAQYPKIYDQIKLAIQSDGYLRTTFFGANEKSVAPAPVSMPSPAPLYQGPRRQRLRFPCPFLQVLPHQMNLPLPQCLQ